MPENFEVQVKVVLANPKAANALRVLSIRLDRITKQVADNPGTAEYLGIRQDLQRALKAARYLSRNLEISTES